MITFLLFGSVMWFWMAFALLIVLDMFFLEWDAGWMASASMVLFIGLVLWMGETTLFTWMIANPLMMLGGAVAYVLIGVPYGLKIEWPLLLKRRSLKYREDRRDFLKCRGINDATLDTEVPEEHAHFWYEADSDWRFVSKNKGRIISLMSWWPIAMIKTFLREPFLVAYNWAAAGLQASADREAEKIGLLTDQETRIRVEKEAERKRELRTSQDLMDK